MQYEKGKWGVWVMRWRSKKAAGPFAAAERQNKYNAKTCRCWSKHIHDSALEANVCNRLLADVKDGKIESYKTQVSYPLSAFSPSSITGLKVCYHVVDFEITHFDNRTEVWEAKGFATALWDLKRKLFEANYPAIKYTVVRK